MRMKFNKSSQLLLVSAASLLAAGLITACTSNTLDFVFVSSSLAAGTSSYGEIDVFEINSVSGAMRQIPASPFPSGGRNPVAEAVSSDNANLYVVNRDDNSIVQFLIGPDGKLYPESTVNTPGIFPIAAAVSGSNLFIVDTYQPLPSCSSADPCPGSVGVFPILAASGSGSTATAGGGLGTPLTNASIGTSYWPLMLPSSPGDIMVPTAINVLKSGTTIFVTAYDSSVTPNVGYVFGFSIGSGGMLTALNGGVPFTAGVHPSAIASDSTSKYVYVTDSIGGNIRAYSVASGILSPVSGSPFLAGDHPSAIVTDSGYLYVANSQDGNVEAYSISSSNGALKFLGGSATPITYATGTQPVAMSIDPSASHFLFTANFLSNNVSNFELNASDGTLINTQHSPYTSNAQPTAVVAIPHGSAQK
jgi:6-phosphogluconolactonase (cycloisomerase 2 family)